MFESKEMVAFVHNQSSAHMSARVHVVFKEIVVRPEFHSVPQIQLIVLMAEHALKISHAV